MSRKTPILVVEADRELREELVDQLNQQDDLRARGADGEGEALAALEHEWFGLVLVDCAAVDAASCEGVRIHAGGAPVLALTGHEGGLAEGADETLRKPFRFSALLARIRFHLRAREVSDEGAVQIGPFEFRAATKALLRDESMSIRLTEKEASILSYLLRAGDKAVAREELLREVWGYNSGVTTHTLETHIYRLRQKIEPDADSPRILVTETGGYRLQP